MSASILVVEDDAPMRRILVDELRELGYTPQAAARLAEARAQLERQPFELVLTDLALPDGSGMEVLGLARETQPGVPVVLLSGCGTIDDAVTAIKRGATDFLQKPLDPARLAVAVANGIASGRAVRELELLRRQVRQRASSATGTMVGESAALRGLVVKVRQLAATDSTVLIQGESGTGKELVARALHEGSQRRERPFVAVDCGALDSNLLASELFGHVRGAFTGADTSRQGLFEAAHGGTLFLDEIGNLGLELQARLLRVLQERRVRPLGASAERELDVRVIAATNRDLRRSSGDGTFRSDLYYRLAVVTLDVPPLRERPEDVAPLVRHFARMFAAKFGRATLEPTPEALARMTRYAWPGNVRELANVVERAAITSPDGIIREADLPELEAGGVGALATARGHTVEEEAPIEPLEDALRRAEAATIRRALQQCPSKAEAARRLGISRRALYDKLDKLAIEPN